MLISGHSDCRSPCDSYVVKHADSYRIACHQTVDHQLRSPYMVNILGGYRKMLVARLVIINLILRCMLTVVEAHAGGTWVRGATGLSAMT
jgi:hypothetical protein